MVKPAVIAAIGDIAYALGASFVKYAENVFALLNSACRHAIHLTQDDEVRD